MPEALYNHANTHYVRYVAQPACRAIVQQLFLMLRVLRIIADCGHAAKLIQQLPARAKPISDQANNGQSRKLHFVRGSMAAAPVAEGALQRRLNACFTRSMMKVTRGLSPSEVSAVETSAMAPPSSARVIVHCDRASSGRTRTISAPSSSALRLEEAAEAEEDDDASRDGVPPATFLRLTSISVFGDVFVMSAVACKSALYATLAVYVDPFMERGLFVANFCPNVCETVANCFEELSCPYFFCRCDVAHASPPRPTRARSSWPEGRRANYR